MIRRVAGELMGMKNIVVLNDEAHHCYRERPLTEEEAKALKGDELAQAKENNEAARLWISGLEAVKRELGVNMVYDLSATPFFLRGSGYREGSLFGWVMSDFSLMDAIECGIVKLPRVPIMDNVPGGDTPMFRNLWEHVGKQLPKKGARRPRARSAKASQCLVDRHRRALWPLRQDLRGVATRRHRRGPGVHPGVQQHGHVQTGARLHRRV
jgi:hypothetical protein